MASRSLATIKDLARCERSRVSRRGAIATLLVGVAVAGIGAQIVAERERLYERRRRRRHYAGTRRLRTTVATT